MFCRCEQSTYNVAWGLPECTRLPVFSFRKLNAVLLFGKSLCWVFACHLSSLPAHLRCIHSIPKEEKLHHLDASAPHAPLYFSLCEYQSYAIGEIRIEPFKNETEAEGLVLISFFLSFCVSLFWHENENARMETTTQHQKDMFNFIHYNSHELVELNLPPNSKNRRPGTEEKETKPKTKQNKKTIQSNCELM